ncbi:MAG: hypothetical protein ACXVH2_05730 [Methanobacterium sp.]
MENKKKNWKAEYITAIIFGLIFLYIANNLLNWNIYFITGALNQVLWIINLSIIVTIIGNILLLAYSPQWFRHVIKIIINIISLISIYFVYIVFPFNFYNSFINWGVSIFLILIMIGIVIAIIVEVYQFITR